MSRRWWWSRQWCRCSWEHRSLHTCSQGPGSTAPAGVPKKAEGLKGFAQGRPVQAPASSAWNVGAVLCLALMPACCASMHRQPFCAKRPHFEQHGSRLAPGHALPSRVGAAAAVRASGDAHDRAAACSTKTRRRRTSGRGGATGSVAVVQASGAGASEGCRP